MHFSRGTLQQGCTPAGVHSSRGTLQQACTPAGVHSSGGNHSQTGHHAQAHHRYLSLMLCVCHVCSCITICLAMSMRCCPLLVRLGYKHLHCPAILVWYLALPCLRGPGMWLILEVVVVQCFPVLMPMLHTLCFAVGCYHDDLMCYRCIAVPCAFDNDWRGVASALSLTTIKTLHHLLPTSLC